MTIDPTQYSTETQRSTLELLGELVDERLAELEPTLIQLRRHLHQYPEASGQEKETTRFIGEQLTALGVKPRFFEHNSQQVGVCGDLSIGRVTEETPLLAIRADLDALEIADQKQVDYRSTVPHLMHACGHDAHTVMNLGVAMAVSQIGRALPEAVDEDWGLRLRFVFQPAEESAKGAHWLTDQGVLEGVSAILGLHVDPERLVGQVGIRYGVLTANCDEVLMLVSGQGGHSARPHTTIDPIASSAQLITALYQALPRSVDSRNPAVFSVGKIVGGSVANVIPQEVIMHGSLRTIDQATRQTLQSRIQEIADGIARITRTTIHLDFLNPLASVHNDPRIAALIEQASAAVVGTEHVQHIDRPSMGGEDFSVYLAHVPGAMLRLGCSRPGEEPVFLHSPRFDIDEKTLCLGSRILARTALLWSMSTSGNPG